MSHTNKTPNMELPQFIGSDVPTWLGDINSAFSKIDSYTGTANAVAQSAQVGANQANAGLSTLTSTVTEIGNTVTEDHARLTLHSTHLNEIDEKIGNSDISEIGTSITDAIVNLSGNTIAYANKATANLTVPTATDFVSGATVTLSAGIWVVFATAQYSGNSVGSRRVQVSRVSDGAVIIQKYNSALSDTNLPTTVNAYAIANFTEEAVLAGKMFQDSGATLNNCQFNIFAIKLA